MKQILIYRDQTSQMVPAAKMALRKKVVQLRYNFENNICEKRRTQRPLQNNKSPSYQHKICLFSFIKNAR